MAHTDPTHYDVIMAGGGASGLSTAYHLQRAMPGISMLIVDEQVKARNDHTWCFWSRDPSYLDEITYRTWDRLAIVSNAHRQVVDLAPYRYRMVRASDYYRFMRAKLAGLPGVQFLRGTVSAIGDGPDTAETVVNAIPYSAAWVFDSRYRPSEYRPLSRRHHYLSQHFVGWEIETDAPAFDPGVPRLFDFRTPQRGETRFFYVLPFSATQALVEHTVFSREPLPTEAYEDALRAYLAATLGGKAYRLLGAERDLIPMTDHPFPRRSGRRVLNIGTRGGRVKPSSGFAFHRIQKDAAAIARSMQAHGHPFDLPRSPARYRLFDAVFLQVLVRQGGLGESVFLKLFQKNPIQRVFRFLDEEDTLWGNLKLMVTMPTVPFLSASISVALAGRA